MIERLEYEGRIEYLLNFMFHRSNGPARIWKYTDDWCWCLANEWHRYYGPAHSFDGAWHIHGEYIK